MTADFTFWGHNCFLIETDDEALLIDPWLNDTGAFFGSWHQWPPNGHLRGAVQERCAEQSLSIFLSHEQQDHFDKETLRALSTSTLRALSSHRQCTVYIPAYKDKFLREALRDMKLRVVEVAENETVGTDIRFRIFIDDDGIDHHSAIVVAAPGFTFFNQNDCKLSGRLPLLASEIGPIDYYAAQCSGAPARQRQPAPNNAAPARLRDLLDSATVIAARFFVAAGGPAFFPFLDPALSVPSGTDLVQQDELDKYLRHNGMTNMLYPRPGERIGEDTNRAPVTGPSPDQVRAYRATHRDSWQEIDDTFSNERFAQALQRRLDLIAAITLPPDTPAVAFNWGAGERDWLTVNLVRKTLLASGAPQPPCLILTASTRYFSLMCGYERRQDIASSMRARVQRLPDVSNPIADIFLWADESDLADALVQRLNLAQESIAA
jgi:UDP-MurNAc hydroxylase